MIRTQETLPIHPYTRTVVHPKNESARILHLVIQALVIIILTAGFLPAGLLVGVGLVYESRELILPGVSAVDIDLSGRTQEQAMQLLNDTWNVNRHITLTGGSSSWQVSPIELGLFLDPSATVQSAYQVSRRNLPVQLEQILLRNPQVTLPDIGFRPDLAQQTLARLATELYQPPQEAGIQFVNGQWEAIPGKDGTALDMNATLAQIAADPMGTFFKSQIEMIMKPVTPQVVDLSATVAKLQAYIQKPLMINVYDPIQDETLDWSVSSEALASWLVVSDPKALEPAVHLDHTRLTAYLEKKSASLSPSRTLEPYEVPSDLTQFWQAGHTLQLMARYLPTTYTVVAGDTLWNIARKVEVQYWLILKANPGVSDAALRSGQVLQIPSKNDMLPLPVVMGKRIVISISQQHMWTYENGHLRKDYVISTGIDSSPTMPGVYQVQSHVENAYAENWDLWMPNFLGIYQAVPGFWNGIHGLPVMSNGVRLWANVLGRPITYGCILMDLKDGQDVYNWAEEGVVVEINA